MSRACPLRRETVGATDATRGPCHTPWPSQHSSRPQASPAHSSGRLTPPPQTAVSHPRAANLPPRPDVRPQSRSGRNMSSASSRLQRSADTGNLLPPRPLMSPKSQGAASQEQEQRPSIPNSGGPQAPAARATGPIAERKTPQTSQPRSDPQVLCGRRHGKNGTAEGRHQSATGVT